LSRNTLFLFFLANKFPTRLPTFFSLRNLILLSRHIAVYIYAGLTCVSCKIRSRCPITIYGSVFRTV
jgi:hypothetical protein